MNAIVAVTADWGIGHAGRLLVSNPADMRYFVEMTTPHTVVMGRVTLESFPGGRPLKGRRNVVLTHDTGYADTHPGVECVGSVAEVLALVGGMACDEAWLIGGGSAYRELLPFCRRALVTYNEVVRPADAYFPDLDADPAWRLVHRGHDELTDEGIRFHHRIYDNLQPRECDVA